MAEHILGLGIGPPLATGSFEIIDKIATLAASKRRRYSFATKYCAFHRPEMYPIYDNFVDRLLWRYEQHYRFAGFRQEQLRDYTRYVAVLRAFQQHFGLEAVTLTQLDKYLWFSAKELFGANG